MSMAVQTIPSIRLLQGLEPRAQQELLERYFDHRTYPAGATIVQRHDEGNDVYIVLSGFAYARVSHDIRVSFEPGEAFGEVCLIDQGYRSATVFADDEVSVAVLARDAFATMKREHPGAAAVLLTNIASVLAGRLRKTNSLARAAERKTQEVAASKEASWWERVKEILTSSD